jgi:hypothetical protein
MSCFNLLVEELLKEFANASGDVFGPAATFSYGNQFPSQNDSAYAPGDARIPYAVGAKSVKRKKKLGKRKKLKNNQILVQRRTFPTSL